MHRRFHTIGCLVVIGLVLITLLFGKFDKGGDTANTILAAHRACEAQTGGPCD